jgi:hypothetical protein
VEEAMVLELSLLDVFDKEFDSVLDRVRKSDLAFSRNSIVTVLELSCGGRRPDSASVIKMFSVGSAKVT